MTFFALSESRSIFLPCFIERVLVKQQKEQIRKAPTHLLLEFFSSEQ